MWPSKNDESQEQTTRKRKPDADDENVEINDEATLDDFDLTIGVNIRGPFLCAKYAAPHLERSGRGVIIVVA